MYLSNLDLKWAIECGHLIVDPAPGEDKYDTDGIDLHLDKITEAKIWDLRKYAENTEKVSAPKKMLAVGTFDFKKYGKEYFKAPPEVSKVDDAETHEKVVKYGGSVIIRPGGFLLWQTREFVGTPERFPNYVVFIDGKSARARTGLLVHVTAPTIHAGWSGNITLELANLGPFDLALSPGDSIAQIRVAKLSNPPKRREETRTISSGQTDVTGAAKV